jgi:hypothetical protein
MALGLDQLSVRLTVKYITLIVGLLATMFAVFIYIYLSKDGPKVEGIMATAAAGIALTALIYTAMNLHLLSDTQKETIQVQQQAITIQQQAATLQQQAFMLQQESTVFQKRMYATELVSQWNSPETKKITLVADAMGKDIKELNPREVADLLKRDKDKQVAVLLVLGFLENMALAIKHDLADEAFLKEFFHVTVKIYYHALKIVIELERKEYKNDSIFNEFEALVKRW